MPAKKIKPVKVRKSGPKKSGAIGGLLNGVDEAAAKGAKGINGAVKFLNHPVIRKIR